MAKQAMDPQTILFPLPAVMVSCQKKGEKPNIITLAWVGVVCSEPPMVGIAFFFPCSVCSSLRVPNQENFHTRRFRT